MKECERLTRLINQVLDLAKLEAGAADWRADEVNLRELIGEALSSTSQLMREKGITLAVETPDAVPLLLLDRDRITQVLLNLLSNAIKFCDSERGAITVRLHAFEHVLQVSVQDNGPGINPQGQQVIFDKFRQVHDRRNGKPQGTGLGLPISKQIISYYGGDLWVDSVPGQGATFSFTLPLNSVDS